MPSSASFPGGSDIKHLPAIWETWVWALGWGDPLEEGMATHSSILAWRIPRMEDPGGLQSMGASKSRRPLSGWVQQAQCPYEREAEGDHSRGGKLKEAGLRGSEEGIHRAWTPSQACPCQSCAATSPVDSDKTPLQAGESWRAACGNDNGRIRPPSGQERH